MNESTNQNQSILDVKKSIQPLQVNDYSLLLKYQYDCGLTKHELDQLLKIFKKYDSNKLGQLAFHRIQDLLKGTISGYQITTSCKERIFREIENRNTQKLDFQALLYIVRVVKDYNAEDKEEVKQILESEYIDAFVALGGNVDGTGYVNKQTMIQILEVEFDLNFELEQLLEKLEIQSEELDFDTFKDLFVSQNQRGMQKHSSVISMLSHRSRQSQISTNSIKTVKIRMRDFEKYYASLNQEPQSPQK